MWVINGSGFQFWWAKSVLSNFPSWSCYFGSVSDDAVSRQVGKLDFRGIIEHVVRQMIEPVVWEKFNKDFQLMELWWSKSPRPIMKKKCTCSHFAAALEWHVLIKKKIQKYNTNTNIWRGTVKLVYWHVSRSFLYSNLLYAYRQGNTYTLHHCCLGVTLGCWL